VSVSRRIIPSWICSLAGIALLSGCAPEKIKLSVKQACIDSSGHFQVTLHSNTNDEVAPASVCLLICDKNGDPVTYVPPGGLLDPQPVEVFLDSPRSQYCNAVEAESDGTYGDGYSEYGAPEMVADALKKHPEAATWRLVVYMHFKELQEANLSSAYDPDQDTKNHELIVFRSEALPIKTNRSVAAFIPADLPEPPPKPPEVDLLELASAYESNSIKADNHYLRQKFRVRGVVVKVGRDGDKHPFLAIADDMDGHGAAICYFSTPFENQISRLDAGQKVTVEGFGAGTFESAPLLGECRLIPN
jgi:hypothetical protein